MQCRAGVCRPVIDPDDSEKTGFPFAHESLLCKCAGPALGAPGDGPFCSRSDVPGIIQVGRDLRRSSGP